MEAETSWRRGGGCRTRVDVRWWAHLMQRMGEAPVAARDAGAQLGERNRKGAGCQRGKEVNRYGDIGRNMLFSGRVKRYKTDGRTKETLVPLLLGKDYYGHWSVRTMSQHGRRAG